MIVSLLILFIIFISVICFLLLFLNIFKPDYKNTYVQGSILNKSSCSKNINKAQILEENENIKSMYYLKELNNNPIKEK